MIIRRAWVALGVSLLSLIMGIAPALTPMQIAAQEGTATAEATTAKTTISIWWPSPIYKAEPMAETIVRFNDDQDTLLNIRVKRAEGAGGIYGTLYNAKVVAPTIIPDLTLMRRGDLIKAAANGLIYPIISPLTNDLYPSGVALGIYEGTQFGLPYALETHHMVYRSAKFSEVPTTLDTILDSQTTYFFPAGLNPNLTLVGQYLAAGGSLSGEEGRPTLDREPLIAVLRYYEAAAEAGLLNADMLAYTSSTQYWSLFTIGDADTIQTNSSVFLAQRANLSGFSTAPIPEGMPIVDGWLWVLTTGEPQRQRQALETLLWFFDETRQGNLSMSIGFLPSQSAAFAAWRDDPYAALCARLLSSETIVPPPDMIPQRVASALQTALEDVLNGRKTAEEAADNAVELVTRR